MPSAELNKKQILALNLPEKVKSQEILSGLAEIAAYTGLSIKTIRRAIKKKGLPAASVNPGKGKLITTKQNIDHWLAKKHLSYVIEKDSDRIPEYRKMRTIDKKLRAIFASREPL